jgi:amidohydrolase
MNSLKKIGNLTDEMKDVLVKHRRDIHQNPELSGMEEKTSTYVAAILEANNVDVTRNVGGYGVVGIIKGRREGRTIALRADMDALSLHDDKQKDYASKVPGTMHSCGHDVHTAVLLGVATVLSKMRGEFDGSVKLIFQPSEERPGGGAWEMIQEGVLENPVPSAIIALHVFPDLSVGKIGCKSGIITASTDGFAITIHGKSGHAARPHQTIDAILVTSHVIETLQHIISRRIDPLHPAVITIGTISGGTMANIVADRVELTGTVRSLNPEIREKLPELMEQVVKGTTEAMGANYEFTFTKGNPSVVNDEGVASLIIRSGRDILGNANVVELEGPTMGGEDFSLFTERIPGSFFRLGTSNPEKGIIHPLHHRLFDVDEDALLVGVKVMSWSAISFLKEKQS